MSVATHQVAQSVPVSPRDDLYFIEAESGHVKIGRAKNVAKRKSSLQSGCFEKLTLRAVLQGRGYEEGAWQAAFQDDRLKGEWFGTSKDLDKAIELAIAGKDWWHHLMPPSDFPLSDDDDEWEDDLVDWHIALQFAITALRNGEKPPTRDAEKLDEFGRERLVQYVNWAALNSYDADAPKPCSPSDNLSGDGR